MPACDAAPPAGIVGAMFRHLLCLFLICVTASAIAAETVATRVADGVYAFIGERGDIAPDNRGRIGNGGFIVGDDGIVVIDTGVSDREGRARLAAIRAVSARPIVLVVVTHAVQEFLFGNTAFVEAGAELLCHAKSAELMRARCEHCLENLRLILGEDEMAGTRLIIPTRVVDGDTDLVVGGRRIALLHPGWASTPGDLLVLDRATGVLFTGGLVVNGRIPELRDGRFDDWVAAIDRLAKIPATMLVPGYGPPMLPADAVRTRDYLLALDGRVRGLYESNRSLMETIEQATLPQFATWSGYETVHRKNTLGRYLELELQELGK